MRVTYRVSTGGTSKPVRKRRRLHGRNSTATIFDRVQYRTARRTGASFDRYLRDRNLIGPNRSQRSLTRDKGLLDRRLRFVLPRVDRLSEGPGSRRRSSCGVGAAQPTRLSRSNDVTRKANVSRETEQSRLTANSTRSVPSCKPCFQSTLASRA